MLFVGKIADRIAAPFLVACGQFFVCGIACLFWGALTETITLEGIQRNPHPWIQAYFRGERAQLRGRQHGA